MPQIYIAGPISTTDEWDYIDNCMRGIIMAYTIAALGHAPYCPHLLALEQKEYPEAASMTDDDWLDVVMQALAVSSAVIFLEGWTDSPGCRKEHAFAKSKQIPIFYSTRKAAVPGQVADKGR
jgi:hypothetical protein